MNNRTTPRTIEGLQKAIEQIRGRAGLNVVFSRRTLEIFDQLHTAICADVKNAELAPLFAEAGNQQRQAMARLYRT
jgi:hypothetical protein